MNRVLIDAAQNDGGNNGAGALAFLVVGALFVAGWFLYRSLRHQLGRIDFDESAGGRAESGRADSGRTDSGTGSGGTDASSAPPVVTDERSADPDR